MKTKKQSAKNLRKWGKNQGISRDKISGNNSCVNGDANTNAENDCMSILCICVCITIGNVNVTCKRTVKYKTLTIKHSQQKCIHLFQSAVFSVGREFGCSSLNLLWRFWSLVSIFKFQKFLSKWFVESIIHHHDYSSFITLKAKTIRNHIVKNRK